MKDGAAKIYFSLKRYSPTIGSITLLVIIGLLHYANNPKIDFRPIMLLIPFVIMVFIIIKLSEKPKISSAGLCPHCRKHYLSKKSGSEDCQIYKCPDSRCPEVKIS